MKIVSISDWNDKLIAGYVDDGRSYKYFSLTPGGGVEYGKPMPKRRFKNLEWFAEVIGKFDPDAFVLEEPIPVNRLDFRELTNLLSKDKRFHQSSGNEGGR
jgi:hypothetical protein